MLELIENGVNNIVCVQPFGGCLLNHITGKGVTAVDYDPVASEINQINRIKLLMSVARQNVKC
jgi:predicted nucleotide-binding protein (sugar kinase/HSP70/actin superfamily)